MRENKRDQEILYTLTIPQASTKDSGIYACSITDIISNESQTKELTLTVYGIKHVFNYRAIISGGRRVDIFCLSKNNNTTMEKYSVTSKSLSIKILLK